MRMKPGDPLMAWLSPAPSPRSVRSRKGRRRQYPTGSSWEKGGYCCPYGRPLITMIQRTGIVRVDNVVSCLRTNLILRRHLDCQDHAGLVIPRLVAGKRVGTPYGENPGRHLASIWSDIVGFGRDARAITARRDHANQSRPYWHHPSERPIRRKRVGSRCRHDEIAAHASGWWDRVAGSGGRDEPFPRWDSASGDRGDREDQE